MYAIEISPARIIRCRGSPASRAAVAQDPETQAARPAADQHGIRIPASCRYRLFWVGCSQASPTVAGVPCRPSAIAPPLPCFKLSFARMCLSRLTSGFRRAPILARRPASRCSVAHVCEKRRHEPLVPVRTCHSITRSARSMTDRATVSPSTLAVLRFTTSSNLVGCSTGRSPGLAPFSILSTKIAALRCNPRRLGP